MSALPDLGELTPLNDLDVTIVLEDIDITTGTRTPITTGTVTGFIATSYAPDAATADATLSVSGVYVGGNPTVSGSDNYDAGTWLIHIDASVLTVALLNTLFGSGATPYLIVSKSNAVRKVGQLTYLTYSAGTVDP